MFKCLILANSLAYSLTGTEDRGARSKEQGARCEDQEPRAGGLLSPIHINEGRKADPREHGPSALSLAPRAFSIGVVDSLGEGFALNLISELMCTRWIGFGLLT